MGTSGTTPRYCTVAGDEVATTWERARGDLIVEGLPVRVLPTYRGQRNCPGVFWAATNDRTLVYESPGMLHVAVADGGIGTSTSALEDWPMVP